MTVIVRAGAATSGVVATVLPLLMSGFMRAQPPGLSVTSTEMPVGVTLRTIYRDLDTLREAKLPVLAEQGRGRGYALDKHYTVPAVNFSPREAAVLVAIGNFALSMRWVPFPRALQRALDKVRGALSASAQRELLSAVAQMQFVGVPALPASKAVTRAVEEAWFSQGQLRVVYRKANDALSTRNVRIESLVMERTLTLLNCVDESTGEKRQLRLDRIERATTPSAMRIVA